MQRVMVRMMMSLLRTSCGNRKKEQKLRADRDPQIWNQRNVRTESHIGCKTAGIHIRGQGS